DYYPRIIGDDLWALVRAGQEQRCCKDKLGRTVVRAERRHVNLFRSLLVDAKSGSTFHLCERVEAGKDQVVLRCLDRPGGHSTSFDYLALESAVLQLLTEIDVATVLPKKDKGASKVEVLRAQLKNVRADMQAVRDELKAGVSRALLGVLRDKEAEEG